MFLSTTDNVSVCHKWPTAVKHDVQKASPPKKQNQVADDVYSVHRVQSGFSTTLSLP